MPQKQHAAERVLPAINATTQIPELVRVQLVAVSLFCALLAGTGMSRHGFCYIVHGSIFAAAVTFTVYAILDLDSPRGGLICIDAVDRALDALRASLQPAWPAWPATEKRRAGAGPAL